MGSFTKYDIEAVFDLAIFAVLLVGAVWVSFRHGFQKATGWVYLAVFTLVRVIGSGAQLATISAAANDTTPFTIAAIAQTLGLSPLLLATLGLLHRAIYAILPQPWATMFSLYGIRLIQIPALVALILVVLGVTNAPNLDDLHGSKQIQAGVILFLLVFIAVSIMTLAAALSDQKARRAEKGLLPSILLALPFLAVRLVYTLINTFGHDNAFNPISGSIGIHVAMATLEEAVITALYIRLGFYLAVMPKEQAQAPRQLDDMTYGAGRGHNGPRNNGPATSGQRRPRPDAPNNLAGISSRGHSRGLLQWFPIARGLVSLVGQVSAARGQGQEERSRGYPEEVYQGGPSYKTTGGEQV